MNLTLRVPLESFVKLFREMGVLEYKYFVKHSIQVANIAVEIADRLNLPFEKDGVYLSSLLHDVGLILKTSIANYELFVDMFGRISDMERIVLTLDKHDHHSVISWMVVSQIPLCSDCSKSILYHHTPYQKINEKDSIVTLSNCVKVADVISLKLLKYTGSNKELDADSIDEIISSVQKDQGIIDEVKKAAVDLLEDFTKHHLFLEEEPLFHSEKMLSLEEYKQYARVLSALLDFRSPYTRNHSFAVARISELLTKDILGEADAALIFTATLLHDIGKIKTPLNILHKKGRLQANEMIIMKRHVVDTYYMLERAGLRLFSLISAAHHERLDGSGYPTGLKGDQMSFFQKVVQICDVFSALTEKRPYRGPMEIREALDIIEQDAINGKLDGFIVQKLKEMANNLDLREEMSFKHVFEELFKNGVDEVIQMIDLTSNAI
ncbi:MULTISPECIES: HD domain-containing phosphohydrolase [unclassified Thermotoga]|uniref:HD domain-containing protein n=1 Tax=unclassified Thermotoga TaxID=2631113 RepID=UPI000280EB11|nr:MULTISPECIES: HD domain-containing phosphohydrolase [unclassified Thermotoga]AIY87332.1 metal dependent phosphohydrolase [Thermotoga sp. 2812B]EJX26400.1 metal dependent phosphohydrolase [Thermotoga sp. EMP]